MTENTNYGTINSADIENGTAKLVLKQPFEGDDGGISVACVGGQDSNSGSDDCGGSNSGNNNDSDCDESNSGSNNGSSSGESDGGSNNGNDSNESDSCSDCEECYYERATEAERASAIQLTFNVPVMGNLETASSEVWYKFNTSDETTYTIYTTGETDTIGRLYDKDGYLVTLNDDRAGSLNFRIVYPLAANSTYYVKVTAPGTITGCFYIYVKKKILVSKVNVSDANVALDVDGTYTLSASVYPDDADNKDIVFSSNNTTVATVDATSGKITAISPGIAVISARDAEQTGTVGKCEVWVRGKTPVFLIHGRNSNSFEVWGANNRIATNPFDTKERNNNHFDFSVNAMSDGGLRVPYIEKASQEIYSYKLGAPIKVDGEMDEDFTVEGIFNGEFKDGGYISTHSEGGNLAYALKDEEYVENINLFAFNYPNQDAVIHDATKFKAYIENLVDYIRTSSNDDAEQMKYCFYASKADYYNNNYTFNIVGHSMGGLVARYYIENLEQDTHVEKLITICTPHWGSGAANASNFLSINHMLCDHDLDNNSKMYGETHSNILENGCTLWDVTELWVKCTSDEYVITDTLNYPKSRKTIYYAIAAIDFFTTNINDDEHCFFVPTTISTYNDLDNFLRSNSINNNDNPSSVAAKQLGDNLVGFLSQMGWTGDDTILASMTPRKQIAMESIFVLADTNGGNADLLNILHNKAPHRKKIISQVIKYLS